MIDKASEVPVIIENIAKTFLKSLEDARLIAAPNRGNASSSFGHAALVAATFSLPVPVAFKPKSVNNTSHSEPKVF